MASKKKKKKKSSQLARQKANKRKKNKERQKVAQMPKRMSVIELESWKDRLYPLIEEANHRIEMIQHSGYHSYAVQRVLDETDRDYFDISNCSTREDLVTEVTRARVFLTSKGSTIEGAILENAELMGSKYIGKFGNQYHNLQNHYKNYDIHAINGEIASKAFETYRKIEEHRASEIVNEGGYGSENLIVAIYDAEVRGMDSFIYGERLLDAFEEEKFSLWEESASQIEGAIAISRIFTDNIGGFEW